MDDLLSTRIRYATRIALQSYTKEFKKKAQEEKKLYIDVVKKSSTITESLENVDLAKSSSQPQSPYEAAASLQTRQDGKAYSLKKSHEDKDKDEDPLAGPNQGSSKGSKSLSKSSGKTAQSEESVFETPDTEMSKSSADTKHNWFKKLESQIAKAKKPPLTFDELMSTPIDLSPFVMNHLKIDNLTQQHLVGPTFNLLKGTCKSRLELKYHFEECYKAVTDRLDWTNPEGHQYPFNLSKPLPLIEVQVRRDENTLHKFKEGDFLNLNLRDIEDMMLLLFQKKNSNLERDVIFDLNVALRIFTRSIVVLKWVEDLQLGVESYQKKLNITKPETFRSDISKLTPYTAYKNPQGIIYQDKLKRNRLMSSDELYKFCDGTLTSVRRVLHDITSSLEMDYLPKRTWSKLDRKRSRIIIKAIDQQLVERRLNSVLILFPVLHHLK
ncbi:hypothetical protein Tco_0707876 [Tanacetum coccineum]